MIIGKKIYISYIISFLRILLSQASICSRFLMRLYQVALSETFSSSHQWSVCPHSDEWTQALMLLRAIRSHASVWKPAKKTFFQFNKINYLRIIIILKIPGISQIYNCSVSQAWKPLMRSAFRTIRNQKWQESLQNSIPVCYA